MNDGHRRYIQDPKSSYALPIDEAERDRLRFQHSIIRRAIQTNNLDDHERWPILVPDPNFKLHPGDHVLDSGTGGGDWLLEAASSNSSLIIPELDGPPIFFKGIDISTAFFPSPPFLSDPESKASVLPPRSISFSQNSVTALPHTWSSTFTLIHQRYLIIALRRSEWITALNELHRVLKPGGWLTIVEGAPMKAGVHMEKLMQYQKEFFDKNEFIYYSEKEIPEMVRSIRGPRFDTVNGSESTKAADSDGFIPSSIGTKVYRIPLGAANFPPGSAERQLAEDAQKNLISVFRSTKRSESKSKSSPDSDSDRAKSLNVDGSASRTGLRNEEYTQLVNEVEREMNEMKGAYMELVLVYAQKSFDRVQD